MTSCAVARSRSTRRSRSPQTWRTTQRRSPLPSTSRTTSTDLLGGTPVMSCVTLAALVHGEVTTIEGLADEARDLREAFADAGAFQCGYCTPGQIVRATALLRQGSPAGEQAVRFEMSGNICRCTGYTQIVDAIQSTARRRAVRRQSDLSAVSAGDAD